MWLWDSKCIHLQVCSFALRDTRCISDTRQLNMARDLLISKVEQDVAGISGE